MSAPRNTRPLSTAERERFAREVRNHLSSLTTLFQHLQAQRSHLLRHTDNSLLDRPLSQPQSERLGMLNHTIGLLTFWADQAQEWLEQAKDPEYEGSEYPAAETWEDVEILLNRGRGRLVELRGRLSLLTRQERPERREESWEEVGVELVEGAVDADWIMVDETQGHRAASDESRQRR
ncbi:hypothetical protein K461DRAFT_278195 [Myriangium duriaei CBS 260.36]|uniref:Uncharacterized protein n=1 Tax=Myriangium duriaei CBS 260.36 TaxID=1168546 RepID=A0A9P4J6R4_9PEZI|nr:hypothetical protein K461DRAFT_278195 [Myriangium duriaei CBS 260.36]